MTISKERISSPLEAGSSLLDTKQLPPQLTSALEYVSSRLARKGLHLSLIVVRKDVNVPSAALPRTPQRSPSPALNQSITTSPAHSLFGSSPFTRSLNSKRSTTSMSDSGSVSSSSSASSLSRTHYPSLPSSPRDQSAIQSQPPSPTASQAPNPYGITLIHASTLTPKAEKILRHLIAKAEKKFPIGSGWLSPLPLTNKITCSRTNDLIRRSLAQSHRLFSSEGLTLLSLDHVYTFKCHLHTYSNTLLPSDLTLAIDELRRLVLAQHGRRITKGYLMRAYDWLGVSLAALVDVNEGYKVAYGGQEKLGGIDVQNEERRSPPPLKTNFTMPEIRKMTMELCAGPWPAPLVLAPLTTPASSTPLYSSASSASSLKVGEDMVQVGESAKGRDLSASIIPPLPTCSSPTPEKMEVPDRGPHRRGAVTPNGFEDITPVTKGEWCFLMVGDGWKGGKRVPVTTC